MSKALDSENGVGSFQSGDTKSYVQRLDLSADPFADDFESDYFFPGAMRQQQLEQLLHFSRFSHQVVMLLGATGSGSSTVLDHAYSQLQELMDCCYIDAEEDATERQLLSVLDDQLQLNLETPINSAELLAAVQSIAIVDGEPEPILLAIDQAHFLSIEAYQLLFRLVTAAGDTVRLVLVGEYQCQQLAASAHFDKKQLKVLELESLTEADTADYVLGLLQSVAYAGVQPLSSEQLAVLQQQSSGNLAEINHLLPALLMAEKLTEKRPLNFPIPLAHIAAVAILATALIASWLYQEPYKENTVVDAAANGQKNPSSNTDVVGVVTRKMVAVEAEPLPDTVQTEDTAEAPIITLSSDTAAKALTSSTDTIVVQPEQEFENRNSPPLVIEMGPVVAVGQASTPKIINADNLEVVAAKPKLVVPTAAVEPVIKPDITSAKSASAPAPANILEEPPVKISITIPPREQNLLGMPKQAFMLQLMGSVDEARTRKFVKRYIGQLPLTYFETRLKAKPWFVVITGPYDNKQAANIGVETLPPALQKQRPWARSVAGIQENIRSNRR